MNKPCGRHFPFAILLPLYCSVHHLTVIASSVISGDEYTEGPPCRDHQDDCPLIVADTMDPCRTDPSKMLHDCPKSCKFCQDEDDSAAAAGRPLGSHFHMGVPQKLDGLYVEEFEEFYMKGVQHLLAVAENPELNHMLDHCYNQHEMCTQWAIYNNCFGRGAANAYLMATLCCPVCTAASQLDFLKRCPMDPDAYTAFSAPGDVTKHFERTITEFPQYSPKVLSRPTYVNGDDETSADYKIGPWIITLDAFLSEEEAQRLIYWGHVHGYERSEDGGEIGLDGTWKPVITEERTSSEAWCAGKCFTDPIVQKLLKRVENVTGIPIEHSDWLQLLKYDKREFYLTHEDYHSYQAFSQTGARILTFYMYLNDVEYGGGTNFPFLDITVTPKFGRVAMWSNVKDEDPNEGHVFARHQALPVIKGVKYGATAWFHHRPYSDECGR
jgi:prolyl 4-hydroxylase